MDTSVPRWREILEPTPAESETAAERLKQIKREAPDAVTLGREIVEFTDGTRLFAAMPGTPTTTPPS